MCCLLSSINIQLNVDPWSLLNYIRWKSFVYMYCILQPKGISLNNKNLGQAIKLKEKISSEKYES